MHSTYVKSRVLGQHKEYARFNATIRSLLRDSRILQVSKSIIVVLLSQFARTGYYQCPMVSNFRHSNIASEKLASIQESAGKAKLRVKQQVVTRWNSKLAMVQRLLEIKDELVVALSGLL